MPVLDTCTHGRHNALDCVVTTNNPTITVGEPEGGGLIRGRGRGEGGAEHSPVTGKWQPRLVPFEEGSQTAELEAAELEAALLQPEEAGRQLQQAVQEAELQEEEEALAATELKACLVQHPEAGVGLLHAHRALSEYGNTTQTIHKQHTPHMPNVFKRQ